VQGQRLTSAGPHKADIAACMQISDKDVQIVKQIGRGASSVVRHSSYALQLNLREVLLEKVLPEIGQAQISADAVGVTEGQPCCRCIRPTLLELASMWLSRRLTALTGCKHFHACSHSLQCTALMHTQPLCFHSSSKKFFCHVHACRLKLMGCALTGEEASDDE